MLSDCLQFKRGQQVVLQLRRGIDSHAQIAAILAAGDLSSTLYDICRDRHRRADRLSAKTAVVRPTYFAGHTMRIKGKRMGLLPDFEILEIAHPE